LSLLVCKSLFLHFLKKLDMKNAVKGVARQAQSHKAIEDTFPSNPLQSELDGLGIVLEPTTEYSYSEEEDFRRLLRSSYQPTKAPAHLLQKIKQNLRQLDTE